MAKILQVCNTSFYLNRFLSPLVYRLTEEGHEVDCVCEGDMIDEGIRSACGRIFNRRFPTRISLISFASTIVGLYLIIRKGKYDCVQSHNRNASIAARITARVCRVPLNLYTAHGMYFHDGQTSFTRYLAVQLERILSRLTTYTLSQSKEDSNFMVKNGFISEHRISTIGNGVDTDAFSPILNRAEVEKSLGLSSDVIRIVTVGRLVRQKRFQDLVKAYALLKKRIRKMELVVVGGNIAQDVDPFQESIRTILLKEQLSDNVIVTGIVSNVESYLAASDIFVLPSLREGLPTSIIEAMAVGLPVIATNIRGCKELVLHGRSGYLYEPRNISELAHYLEDLILSPARRISFGRHGREIATRNYRVADYVSRQVSAIECHLNNQLESVRE